VAEEVLRIVATLQLREPVVGLGAVGRPDPFPFRVGDEVDVGACRRKRCECVSQSLVGPDVEPVFRVLGPGRHQVVGERHTPVAEGRCLMVHPRHRTAHLMHVDLRHRGRQPCAEVHENLDQL
jgi:hypothetical protein